MIAEKIHTPWILSLIGVLISVVAAIVLGAAVTITLVKWWGVPGILN
jgi:hypothetical protein